MKFDFAYNKPNSFFRNKKATANQDLVNGNDEKIVKGTVVTINSKSRGLKVYFDIFTEDGTQINNVSYDSLDIIK